MDLLPLEKVFARKAQDRASFPSMNTDYVHQYVSLVQYLRAHVYKHIDTGLAANSHISGFYTGHDGDHFDEVVRYAGYLLDVETGEEDINLNAYELYMLLVAIRVHDAGNIHGREEHEKKCFSVLRNSGEAVGADDAEKKKIALIAQAHGGRTSSGSRDTISELPVQDSIGSRVVRSQLIASIVRFADEICENNSRAANYLLKFGSIPKHSEIFHQYAASIITNRILAKERRISIQYKIKAEDVAKPWGCAVTGDKTEAFLIDEILDRLEKMDKERRYCNRFSRELYTIDSIRAYIDIIDAEHDVIKSIPVPELCDFGYPEDSPSALKNKLSEYCGAEYGKKLLESVGAK